MLHSKVLMELIERECRDVYRTPAQRAAYRAGMSTAAAACDYIAKQFGARTIAKRQSAAAATLCGDMIEGLRATVRVEPDGKPSD